MSFLCMRIKNQFLINSFALSLTLKQRFMATQKRAYLISVVKQNTYFPPSQKQLTAF